MIEFMQKGPGVADQTPIVALPCSGSSGRQWRTLEGMLQRHLFAPDLMNHEAARTGAGRRDFTLMDEAGPVLHFIDRLTSPVHLVGHSYGGAVALRAALERPEKILSLTLFEPTPFHLLSDTLPADLASIHSVYKLAWDMSRMISLGDCEAAAQAFVDYWAGQSVWSKLRLENRDATIRYIPKAMLEFSALFNEPKRLSSYARLECPVFLLEGEHSPAVTHRIAQSLADALPHVSHVVIPAVGHMAPVTHADVVAAEISGHIRRIVETGTIETMQTRIFGESAFLSRYLPAEG